MSDATFQELEELNARSGSAATIDRLIESMRESKNYDRLFDALCLKAKFELGLPLIQPTAFDDVTPDKQHDFEERYISAAREVGELFLEAGNIPQAWMFLRTIREPEKVAAAIDALDARREPSEETEALINIALYEGANPVKGLEIMLHTNGTCNTITALDQSIHQLPPADRAKAAALLVDTLYEDLAATVRTEVEQRMAMLPPGAPLRELIAGRDWLFADGNYHIDVSHLNSVVRFARSLETGDSHLDKVIELAEYGACLEQQFQYPGDPPFEDFYPAHVQFFKAMADQNRDEAIDYFREKLDAEPDAEDKPMLAYVLVDLLLRCDRQEDALGVAQEYLRDVEDAGGGFSFAGLCRDAGRLDTLREVARDRGDLIRFTAGLVEDTQQTAATS